MYNAPMNDVLVQHFLTAVEGDEADLASAALELARVEYPRLDPARYVSELDRMGRRAAARLEGVPAGSAARVTAFNGYFYDEEGFAGNRDEYEDPRNSFLNEVIDRRTGIPISLALVYIEVARRAGLRVAGVNFPGHFLLRCAGGDRLDADLIVDPFHNGAILSEADCRRLLRQVDAPGDFVPQLLEPATKRQIVIRMLVNLKRAYVRLRSFPQARTVSNLLVALDSSAISELRDRGLLSYHVDDFQGALRDLERYLQLMPRTVEQDDPEARQEYEQIWDHVKTLRRRVAAFN
jgi:regulator of sirC expression with transglutaminase-like and TPR domain